MKALVVSGAGLAGSIVVFLPPARAPASEVETRSYLSAIERICVTGVTPTANKAHEQLVAALAKEVRVINTWVAGVYGALLRRPQAIRTVDSNPHGATMNFWGPRPDPLTWAPATWGKALESPSPGRQRSQPPAPRRGKNRRAV